MIGQTLQDELTEVVQTFFTRLSKEHGVEVLKLAEVWNRVTPVLPVSAVGATVGATVRVKTRASDPNAPKCVYVYQKGKKPGQACGAACSGGSTSYCKKHLKYDSTAAVSDAKTSGTADTGATGVTAKPTIVKPTTTQMTISKNNFGNYEHRATSLVFNSDKKVYGKQVGDKVVGLNATDIENCKRYGFPYLPSAVINESADPTEDEQEIVDEEETVEEDVVEPLED